MQQNESLVRRRLGDASANATAVATTGGWLKVYGRSIGFTAAGACTASTVASPNPAGASTVATLTPAGGGASRRREFCHSTDALSPSTLKHLLKGEGGVQQNDRLADG